jgi:hypothetical protein
MKAARSDRSSGEAMAKCVVVDTATAFILCQQSLHIHFNR